MDSYEQMFGQKIPLQPGDLVLDIGAHVGTFTIPLLLRHPGIGVVAAEPDPANMASLRRALETNGIEPSRYALEEVAVCDGTVDRMAFVIGDAATRGTLAGIGFFREGRHHGRVQVDALSLQDLFQKHAIDRCKLLKMDCEGCEYGVLRNLPREIWSRIDHVILEIHPVSGEDKKSLCQLLIDRGFDVSADEQPNGCIELFCTRISEA